MAERTAEKYYPPAFDPSRHGSINNYVGSHPLGSRARLLHRGILIIRFEVPFHFYCSGCENHVAKGVRYNAQKKTVGQYFSTNILEFSMKCHLCPNIIKFQTDPKECDYVITEGGRKKVETFDAEDAGLQSFMDKESKMKIATDPMAKLEHVVKDKLKAKTESERIEHLIEIQERTFDSFGESQLLRKKFRFEKAALLKQDIEATRDNLSVKLVPSVEEDDLVAENQLFRNHLKSAAVTRRIERAKVFSRPLIQPKSVLEKAKDQDVLLTKIQRNISSKLLGSSQSGVSLDGSRILPIDVKSNGLGNIVLKKRTSSDLHATSKIPAASMPTALGLLVDYEE